MGQHRVSELPVTRVCEQGQTVGGLSALEVNFFHLGESEILLQGPGWHRAPVPSRQQLLAPRSMHHSLKSDSVRTLPLALGCNLS